MGRSSLDGKGHEEGGFSRSGEMAEGVEGLFFRPVGTAVPSDLRPGDIQPASDTTGVEAAREACRAKTASLKRKVCNTTEYGVHTHIKDRLDNPPP